jgi:hypothetical protein
MANFYVWSGIVTDPLEFPQCMVMTVEEYDKMFLRECGIKPEPLSED